MSDIADVLVTGIDWMPRAKRWRKLIFEWHGNPEWPFKVAGELLRQDPGILDRFPWPVEKIGDEAPDTVIYRRTDSGKLKNKYILRGKL